VQQPQAADLEKTRMACISMEVDNIETKMHVADHSLSTWCSCWLCWLARPVHQVHRKQAMSPEL
jgi:hypothetical protein